MNMNNSLKKIIKRELKRIAERKTLYLLSIFIPAFMFSLYAVIYQNELVTELPVAIYDEDNSQLTQKIIEMIEASPSMRIVKYENSINEIKEDFFTGKIQGAFYFPYHLEKDVKKGKSGTVVVYKNTSNLISGNLILKDGSTIIKTLSAGILLKKIQSKGNTYEKSLNIINPIRIETNTLFNPNFGYKTYLVPGLIGFTFQLIIMIVSVLIFSSEFSHNTFHELLELSNNNISLIILGKFIPHFFIHFSNALLIIGIIFPLFKININGSIINLIFLLAVFVFSSLTIAFAVSSLVHDQQFATEIIVFYNTPAFIFSGFTYPLWAMPFIHSFIAQLMPFTHFLNGFLKIAMMNAQIISIKNEILILNLFALIGLLITYLSLEFSLRKHQNNYQSIK